MCSHAPTSGVTLPDPHSDPEKVADMNEKTELSYQYYPDPNLEYFKPDYNPTYLQRILKEGILLATGGAAILLQMAHPGVAQGVNEHSNFAYRPADRLRSTMIYMYCIAFGTSEERKVIIEMVHRAHENVKGPGYSANDPEAQLWVAATLYAAGSHIYELMFGKQSDTDEDNTYQEYSVMATALRVSPEMWPETRKAFWAYWEENIKTLPIESHAKQVGKNLLYNKVGPLWLRLNLPFLRVITAEWLPPRMREAYGLRVHHRRYKLALGFGKIVYPRLPSWIRSYPLKYYLKDMRKELPKMVEVGHI
ncbi:uncharacterized protein PAC_05281 [Phialocephala subalpina]|uniref:ER-bound oxygenase mpaB/mpaB'/Rubber oxygenase catalytic domain-containing protein n=1 Tax=Phialocephala subalpina TaxID=576137 RepID=A0A1L7WRK1_9HELO|nr:uncharacterized protein PAC_05281 [Phialocephala subalpina]